MHYDNKLDFLDPRMWVWVGDGTTLDKELLPTGRDGYGVYFDVKGNRSGFNFKFKEGRGRRAVWEDQHLDRAYHAQLGREIWVTARWHNVYTVPPAEVKGDVLDYYKEISDLVYRDHCYLPDTDVSGGGVVSMLGANRLTDGSILFGFFHPRAARVYLLGNFNDWQCPGHFSLREELFIEMERYRGFGGEANLWLTRLQPPPELEQIEYKFFIQGGSTEIERYVVDPYTRVYSDDYRNRNAVVVDPTCYIWADGDWRTPGPNHLILYELNVYGFTDNDLQIPQEWQGTFAGVIQRIKQGYFHDLGVNTIALMPIAEVPNKGGLGYEPCTFMAVEKDFGTPDEFRELVDTAHRHGLAVIVDQVFNHTSNDFNPLWNLIDDGSSDGGFYFEGKTMWGNRVATGKEEVDNMLIDSCKLFIREYHVDGFRFDATHSYFLNHALLHRLAFEIKDSGFKEDCILIAENLPNEPDLNLNGYNGYAQWSDIFHDKIKALLREGEFKGVHNTSDQLGTMFYFSKDSYAAHTNNTVNYCESHDENSVPYEVATGGPHLQDPWIKDRKARLGLMGTMTALGQPMIYMGQEYGIERERNLIDIDWIKHPPTCHFYNWARRLIKLRARYDGLRLSGFNPADEGRFTWILGPWMEQSRGGGSRVIGWRVNERGDLQQRLLVMLNFEGSVLTVDVDFHTPGRWVKLADLDSVNDLPPGGNKDPVDPDSIVTADGRFFPFDLPPYSGFIYRHHTGN